VEVATMSKTIQQVPISDAQQFARMIEDAAEPFAARIMRVASSAGTRRETTAQRDARERGLKRFNAYGCK
jgi:hypothetical protein